MRRIMLPAALVVLALVTLSTEAGSAGPPKILEFDTMAAVVGPYVGGANPIRNVPGGGLPWAIEEGRGELRTDGELQVEVEGLVLVATGANPITSFKAIVSCQTIGTSGEAAIANVSTGLFPATTAGDSRIEATVDLPSPCFAPIVFVTSPGGSWFAVTGR